MLASPRRKAAEYDTNSREAAADSWAPTKSISRVTRTGVRVVVL